jgi:peptidyl-prolyl cis-trans isomerase A (cyclophilin A)
VIDAAAVTNPDLVPVENTLINASNQSSDTPSSGGSSGGAMTLWGLLLIGVIGARRLRAGYFVRLL